MHVDSKFQETLTARLENQRKRFAAHSTKKHKSTLGQYFTPASIARFMAGLFRDINAPHLRLLDPGCGNAMLSGAVLERRVLESVSQESITEIDLFEIDNQMISALQELKVQFETGYFSSDHDVSVRIIHDDFIKVGVSKIFDDGFEGYTHAILNPPYMKISSSSETRRLLSDVGIETVNLYSAFVALSLLLLNDGGELVAIIPRSFCNGPYYKLFRQLMLQNASILQIHLFESRKKAFSGDGILQENVIIHLIRNTQLNEPIRITTSTDGTFRDLNEVFWPQESVIQPEDEDKIIHIPQASIDLPENSTPLAGLGITVSTGPVVDFRAKEYLRNSRTDQCIPLLYPLNFAHHKLYFPMRKKDKPNWIIYAEETRKMLYPNGYYVVVRRFSSKEEKKRIVANVINPNDFAFDFLGFENHLNVFHCSRGTLDRDVAFGLAIYLNSTMIDQYFRQFNGHTQVNASDLRMLPYPAIDTLRSLGQQVYSLELLSQEDIDGFVLELI